MCIVNLIKHKIELLINLSMESIHCIDLNKTFYIQMLKIICIKIMIKKHEFSVNLQWIYL